jgi:hypothetical protein
VAKVTVSFKCAKCGSNKFEMRRNLKPNDKVTYAKCGASGRYADVQKQAVAQTTKSVQQQLKSNFAKRLLN